MDVTTAAHVLRWYADIEAQMQEVLAVIPPQDKNLRAWSPRLATVLVEACTLVESVLYDVTPEPVQIPGEAKAWKRKDLKLKHYAQLYSARLHLATCPAVFFHEPLDWQRPFEVWSATEACPAPAWWADHNKSKHRRLGHFEDFTLQNALTALAGALVVIATVPALPQARNLFWAMIQHEWINPAREVSPETLDQFYEGDLRPNAYLCVETALFAVLAGWTPLPNAIHHLWRCGARRFMGGGKLWTWTAHYATRPLEAD